MALGLGVPALAQNSDAPIDVTAAPPPSAETIGPSQLRDFNLQGTVTRPADQPAATPAQPATTASAPPRSGEVVPTEAAEPAARLVATSVHVSFADSQPACRARSAPVEAPITPLASAGSDDQSCSPAVRTAVL
jgi:hypothetical protein